VARIFSLQAKFESYFSSWAALVKISDEKVTISAKLKFFLVILMLLLTAFDRISCSRKSICCFFVIKNRNAMRKMHAETGCVNAPLWLEFYYN